MKTIVPGWRKLAAWFMIQLLLSYLAVAKMADPHVSDLPQNLGHLMQFNALYFFGANVGEHGFAALQVFFGNLKVQSK